ncbi:hypothetical protein M4D81_11120 [Paenibacillus sp. p3-SID867]|uniref:hypothetical protein n=1 Tax=Paenibacillus sp. p3-SID867 TaxID=2916363 RepID=UPI0021A34780|nr:hypothetical protein [Paenibacillus sp. p3-SID867]MCT1399569.1 hypothetical protein [Paenibacillus sp. p3-SID867]
MYIKKYAITLLLGTLCLSYTVLTDCLFGFPWYNFMINWQFTLFSIVEKLTVTVLLCLLILPDCYRAFKNKKPRDSTQCPGNAGHDS